MSIENAPMEKFLDGFSDDRWEHGNDDEIIFENENGDVITFSSCGQGEVGTNYELQVWKNIKKEGLLLLYKLEQEIVDGEIENRLSVPPFIDEYWSQATGRSGVVYEQNGVMYPVRNVKGLPRRIDMDKTVELILTQIARHEITTPELVKVKKL